MNFLALLKQKGNGLKERQVNGKSNFLANGATRLLKLFETITI